MDAQFIRECGIAYDPVSGLVTRDGKACRARRGRGYVAVNVRGLQLYAHRIAWLLTHGEWPEKDIDHINGSKSDNRLANLRLATRSENQRNHGLTAANTSGAKGAFRTRGGKWKSQIRVNGKLVYLGLFVDQGSAARAYDEAADRLHGQFDYRKGVAK